MAVSSGSVPKPSWLTQPAVVPTSMNARTAHFMVECPTMVCVGTVDVPERVDRVRYFKELDYVELNLLARAEVTPKTRDRWAASIPRGVVGLVVTTGLRALPPTLVENVTAFGATCVVFPSPSLFSPSQAHRDQLRKFFTDVASAEQVATERVWIPDGLWETRDAVKLATELGVACAFDPLVRPPGTPPEIYEELAATQLYFRVEAPHRPDTLGDEQLEELAILVEHYEARSVSNIRVAFATRNRWRDARAFRKLVGLASSPGSQEELDDEVDG
jgi:hypothetical protein